MRCVFDTNVVVSALLLPDSKPRLAFDHALRQGNVLLSFETLAELYQVLSRERFRKYVGEEDIRRFLSAFTHVAEWVEVKIQVRACRDTKDDKFLELAVSGKANYIVTGDWDLLCLNPFRGIQILTPAAFLESGG